MSEENISTEVNKQFDDFKAKWIGAKVLITGIKHPWRGESGVVSSMDHTAIGFGMKVDLENGESCYVFKGSDIQLIQFKTN